MHLTSELWHHTTPPAEERKQARQSRGWTELAGMLFILVARAGQCGSARNFMFIFKMVTG